MSCVCSRNARLKHLLLDQLGARPLLRIELGRPIHPAHDASDDGLEQPGGAHGLLPPRRVEHAGHVQHVRALDEARARMNEAVRKLMDGDLSAERDVERFDQIIRMHPDYEREQREKADKWATDQRPVNEEALRRMRTLVPPCRCPPCGEIEASTWS